MSGGPVVLRVVFSRTASRELRLADSSFLSWITSSCAAAALCSARFFAVHCAGVDVSLLLRTLCKEGCAPRSSYGGAHIAPQLRPHYWSPKVVQKAVDQKREPIVGSQILSTAFGIIFGTHKWALESTMLITTWWDPPSLLEASSFCLCLTTLANPSLSTRWIPIGHARVHKFASGPMWNTSESRTQANNNHVPQLFGSVPVATRAELQTSCKRQPGPLQQHGR